MGCSRLFGSCLPRPQCTCTASFRGSWPSGAAVCVQSRTSTPVQPSPLRLNAWLTSRIRYSLRVCPPPGLVTYQLIFIYFNAARWPVLLFPVILEGTSRHRFSATSSTLAVSVTNLCITCILLTQLPRFLFSFSYLCSTTTTSEMLKLNFILATLFLGFAGKQSKQFLPWHYTRCRLHRKSFICLSCLTFFANICHSCLSKVQWQSFNNNEKLSNF